MRIFVLTLLLFSGIHLQSQSISEIREGAKSGNPVSMLELSERFNFGQGLDKNEDSATFWIKKAADLNHPEAQFLLGLQRTREIYDAKKYAEGISLLKKAGDQNHADALLKLSEIYRKNDTGTETDKYFSQTQSFEYARKSAEAGNVNAMVYCGNSLLEAKGTKRNDSLAIVYLRKAADEHQVVDAQMKMGDLYLEGTRIGTRDLNKSLEYYRAARDNPRGSLTHMTDATVGIHNVDQVLKRTQNLMFRSTGMLPQGMLTYPVSK